MDWDKAKDQYENKQLFDEHYLCMRLVNLSYNPQDDYKVPSDIGITIGYNGFAGPMNPIWFCVVNDEKKAVYICVRGSRDILDVYSDLKSNVIDFYGCPSHQGFVEGGRTIFDNFPWDKLEPCIRKGYSFLFTGHSLGGACAAIATIEFYQKYRDTKLKCVTFGCPGVLTPDYAQQWYPVIDSVFHIGDPIPFACNHNLFTPKSGVNFIGALAGALKESEYFPLHFLDSKAREDVSPDYQLLLPPGRYFAVGLTTTGDLKVVEYQGVDFFDGLQSFLVQSGHLIKFYISTYDRLYDEKVKGTKSSFKEHVTLPVDFTPIR